eukprot:scaffold5439_cov132-Cylindrotheca_fusiformis.AAC.2
MRVCESSGCENFGEARQQLVQSVIPLIILLTRFQGELRFLDKPREDSYIEDEPIIAHPVIILYLLYRVSVLGAIFLRDILRVLEVQGRIAKTNMCRVSVESYCAQMEVFLLANSNGRLRRKIRILCRFQRQSKQTFIIAASNSSAIAPKQ